MLCNAVSRVKSFCSAVGVALFFGFFAIGVPVLLSVYFAATGFDPLGIILAFVGWCLAIDWVAWLVRRVDNPASLESEPRGEMVFEQPATFVRGLGV